MIFLIKEYITTPKLHFQAANTVLWISAENTVTIWKYFLLDSRRTFYKGKMLCLFDKGIS